MASADHHRNVTAATLVEQDDLGPAVLAYMSPCRRLIADCLGLADLLSFRASCHSCKQIAAENNLRVHAPGGVVLSKTERTCALFSAFPGTHLVVIHPSESWELQNYVEVARFKAVSLTAIGLITDSILALLQGRLASLILDDSDGVTDGGLVYTRGAKKVHLMNVSPVTSAGLSQLVGVEDLGIGLSDAAFSAVAQLAPFAPTLRSLTLHTDEVDMQDCPRFPVLHFLDTNMDRPVPFLRLLAAPLRVLVLHQTNVSGLRLSTIPTLESVTFKECSGVSDDIFDRAVAKVRVKAFRTRFHLTSANAHLFNGVKDLFVENLRKENTVTDEDMQHLTALETAVGSQLPLVTPKGYSLLTNLRVFHMQVNSFKYLPLLAMPALEELHLQQMHYFPVPIGCSGEVEQLVHLILAKHTLKRVYFHGEGGPYKNGDALAEELLRVLPPPYAPIRVVRTLTPYQVHVEGQAAEAETVAGKTNECFTFIRKGM